MFELFSKRQAKHEKAGKADVYQYDKLSSGFRVQVIHIWARALGHLPVSPQRASVARDGTVWDEIERIVAEEHGRFILGYEHKEPFERCCEYLTKTPEVAKTLDLIECSFHVIDTVVRSHYHPSAFGVTQAPDAAIADLNYRFREHGIGYQFELGQIVRVDSQYIHAEAVKPALRLLHAKEFAGAEDEFLEAHKHYRAGDYKAAINEGLKAFESTLKSICKAQRWPYDANKHTAKDLLSTVLNNGLIPKHLESSLAGLRAVLENAVPTTRSRQAAHGQGPEPTEVPDYVAAYVLHVTASNIVFLVEAHKAMK